MAGENKEQERSLLTIIQSYITYLEDWREFMIIGNKTFHVEENAYIMGILNVTPDSFSDGGSYTSLDLALERA